MPWTWRAWGRARRGVGRGARTCAAGAAPLRGGRRDDWCPQHVSPVEHCRALVVVLAVLIGLAVPIVAAPAPAEGPPARSPFTILHTNDFHGNLELVGQQPRRGPGGPEDQRRAHRGGGRQRPPLRRRRHHAGEPALQPAAGPADHRLLQHHRLQRRHLRQPRVRLGPDGPRRPHGAGRPSPSSPPTSPSRTAAQLRPGGRRYGDAAVDLQVFTVGTAPNTVDGRRHRGQLRRDPVHHDRRGHRGPLLPRPVRVDPALLRRARRRVGRHRGAEPQRLHRRRLRLRLHRLRRPDPGRQAQHRRQAGRT